MSQLSNQMADMNQLTATKSITQSGRRADEFFAKSNDAADWMGHLSQPFTTFAEMPELLINFAVITRGLALKAGTTVLEFGTGAGWASRFLTQMGCRVTTVSLSAAAMEMGTERSAPQFPAFDGVRINLPDASIERIICLDAFHQVANPAQLLAEMHRVLVAGGIAGFAEPSQAHYSRPAKSRYEKLSSGFSKDEMNLHFIWELAQGAGFTDCKISAFNQAASLLSMAEFTNFMIGQTDKPTVDTRQYAQHKRKFFLYKGGAPPRDSLSGEGLTADIQPLYKFILADAAESVKVQAVVTNTGTATWLPSIAGLGAVFLGFHVYTREGVMYRESYHWEPLAPDAVPPGASITVNAQLAPLPPGRYTLELDMVSSEVCWFTCNGSPTPHIQVDVLA